MGLHRSGSAEAFLFSGTVASNVRFGEPDADDEELWRGLEVAQAEDFVAEHARVARCPDRPGRDQRLRRAAAAVGIARALVRPARIYIFDDSFSALDFATDARLRAALGAETRDAAVIIVAQRVSTIMHADRIVVLDERPGRRGRHARRADGDLRDLPGDRATPSSPRRRRA